MQKEALNISNSTLGVHKFPPQYDLVIDLFVADRLTLCSMILFRPDQISEVCFKAFCALQVVVQKSIESKK